MDVLAGWQGHLEAARAVLPATETHAAVVAIVAAAEAEVPCLKTSPTSGHSAAQTGSWCPPTVRVWVPPCREWHSGHVQRQGSW